MATAISSPLPGAAGPSEEESFVILGNSIDSNLDSIQVDNDDEPKMRQYIEEGRKLVSTLAEAQMEESTILPAMPSIEKDIEKENNESHTISISTVSSEFIPEDIQAKINEVIDENTQLKNTILENNNSMRSQRDRMLAWQSEVEKTFQTNKNQYQEAKELIIKQKNQIAQLMYEKDAIKNNGKFNTNAVEELQVSTEKLSIEGQEKEKVDALKTEIEELKITVKTLNDELEEIKRSNINLNKEKEILQKETEHQSKMANSLIAESIPKELKVAKEYIVTLEKEKEVLHRKIEEQRQMVNSLSSGNNLLQIEVDNAKKMVNKPNTNEEALRVSNGKLDSLSKYNEQLLQENRNMNQLICSSNEQLVNVQQQLMQAQIAHRQLLQERDSLAGQLQNSDEKASQEQKDKISMFEVQLEQYKSDFEAERTAKETLKSERDQLAEDLMNLHRRNQELQEEVELLRNREWVAPPRMPSPAHSAHSDSPPLLIYSCPICNSKFRSLRLVEEHVETCPSLTP
ncbi:unnamed protein product [Brassicogethes aeneus]|uniref:NF-kappa-B essential modulator NEMO CC2-LZ domain-containing protein n=1 Tax=Brassicogethes aeneus TaxID=1431903 RepID=A0A9P0B0P8_BRAAE|nr:unnamed protein product [Brassicogethes aeneus]